MSMDRQVTDNMIEGFREFRHTYYEQQPDFYHSLIRDGQSPKVLFVGCSDSRVTPTSMFGTEPGDVFVIRNVANLVPPAELDGHLHGTSAAVDFAVNQLNVQHIIINGHSQCGGIKALLHGTGGEYVGPWVEIAREARAEVLRDYADASPEEQLTALEKASILISIENLLTFDSVRRKVVRGELQLHGWYFDMQRGALLGYEVEKKSFEVLV